MITYDPNGYANRDLKDDKFYADLLKSQGIPASNCAISPFFFASTLTVISNNDFFVDMNNSGTPTASAQATVANTRNLYHGSLVLHIIPEFFAAAFNLTTGFRNVYKTLMVDVDIDVRNVLAVPASTEAQYIFPSICFNWLRLRGDVANPGNQGTLHYIFNGIRVTF